MEYVSLTSKEFEVMKIFWQFEVPLTATELVTLSPVKSWSFNSLYPLLNKLLKKGFIGVVGNIRSTKAPTRVFEAKITALEYSNMQLKSIFKDSSKKLDLGSILSCFSSDYKNNDALIEDIEEWIEKNR